MTREDSPEAESPVKTSPSLTTSPKDPQNSKAVGVWFSHFLTHASPLLGTRDSKAMWGGREPLFKTVFSKEAHMMTKPSFLSLKRRATERDRK